MEEATHVPHHLVVKGAEAGATAGAIRVTGMKHEHCLIDLNFVARMTFWCLCNCPIFNYTCCVKANTSLLISISISIGSMKYYYENFPTKIWSIAIGLPFSQLVLPPVV